MLAGGEALGSYALRSASSVLAALAKRAPSIAHRRRGTDIAGRGPPQRGRGRHPFARAILAAAKAQSLALTEAVDVDEAPGHGLRVTVSGRIVQVTSRDKLAAQTVAGADQIPPAAGRSGEGLEANA